MGVISDIWQALLQCSQAAAEHRRDELWQVPKNRGDGVTIYGIESVIMKNG